MYRTPGRTVEQFSLTVRTRYRTRVQYRGDTVLDSTRQVYNLGNGGGAQFTMTLWMGLSQTPEIENGDSPISQVIHLPGTIQKGNTSIL